MKPVVLVALWLWPPSLLAYPSITVLPDEEQNLNHYVQVLQNLVLSVPTREPQDSEKKSRSPIDEDVPQPRVSTPENEVPIRTFSQETTAFPSRHFRLGIDRKSTVHTPFWSIRPNNVSVSVVLHSPEPYIEPEPEPEPEPELELEPEPQPRTASTVHPRPHLQSTHSITEPRTSTLLTTTTRSSHVDLSTESEDVPQLSGNSETEEINIPAGHHHLHIMRNEEILRKISDINSQIQRGPLGDSHNPEYRAYIRASREYLRRSLALAAAAEHKLHQMYRSSIFTGRGDHIDDLDTVINMLYHTRSRLPEYLNIKHAPPELRGKTNIVICTLRKILCVDQVQTQSLIRKLVSNNMKLLELLNGSMSKFIYTNGSCTGT